MEMKKVFFVMLVKRLKNIRTLQLFRK